MVAPNITGTLPQKPFVVSARVSKDEMTSKVISFLNDLRPDLAKKEIEHLKDLPARLNFLLDIALIYLEKGDLNKLDDAVILYQGELHAHHVYHALGLRCVKIGKPELVKKILGYVQGLAKINLEKIYCETIVQSSPEEVKNLLKQCRFQAAVEKANTILTPAKREVAFGHLIRYSLEISQPNGVTNYLKEIKTPRDYNFFVSQICAKYIELSDAINARAMLALFTDHKFESMSTERVDIKFGVDEKTLVKRIYRNIQGNQYQQAANCFEKMKVGSPFRDQAARCMAEFCLDHSEVQKALLHAEKCRPMPRDLLLKDLAQKLFARGASKEAFDIIITIKDPTIQSEAADYFELNPPLTSGHATQATTDFFDNRGRLTEGYRKDTPLSADRIDITYLQVKFLENALSSKKPDDAEKAADQMWPGPAKDEAYKKIALHYLHRGMRKEACRVIEKIHDKRIKELLETEIYAYAGQNTYNTPSVSSRFLHAERNDASQAILAEQVTSSPIPIRHSPLDPMSEVELLTPMNDTDYEAEVKHHIANNQLSSAWNAAKKIKLYLINQELLYAVFKACILKKNIVLAIAVADDIKEEKYSLQANDTLANVMSDPAATAAGMAAAPKVKATVTFAPLPPPKGVNNEKSAPPALRNPSSYVHRVPSYSETLMGDFMTDEQLEQILKDGAFADPIPQKSDINKK